MKYLFLSSEDSTSTHPSNSMFDFTIEFPQPLELEGKWECALTEIVYSDSINGDLYVYCDICAYSYVSDSYKPLLRIVDGSDIFEKQYFIPVTQQVVPRLRLYIRDKQGNIPSVDEETLRCTLALKHGK